MRLIFNGDRLSVIRLAAAAVPQPGPAAGFFTWSRTPDENSLVCGEDFVRTLPVDEVLKREDGWTSFCVDGTLDFGLVGVLARISTPLAQAGVSLFAISTFATDWILIKREQLEIARSSLRSAGFEI